MMNPYGLCVFDGRGVNMVLQRTLRGRHSHWVLLRALPVLAGIFASVLLSAGCTNYFFYPQRDIRQNTLAALFLPEDVRFQSADGVMLHGWFFRSAANRATVLVLHGNAENLSTHINGVLWLVPAGFNVFIFDYRGYGMSEGTVNIHGVHRDAEAALRTVVSLPGIDPDRIILLGQSLGGAIAVNLAAATSQKAHIRALIIESAFSDYRVIAREKLGQACCVTWAARYPLSLLINDEYSPRRRIALVDPVPILFLYGTDDAIVPIHHGRILFDAAGPRKEFWETPAPGHIRAFSSASVRTAVADYLTFLLNR